MPAPVADHTSDEQRVPDGAERLSIVHLTCPAMIGGLESVVGLLARGQHDRGDDVHVVATLSPDVPEPPFLDSLRDGGVSVTTLRLPPRSYFEERAALEALLGQRRPAVVHTHGYRSDILGASVARRAGIPTVTTLHGFTGAGWRVRMYERLQRRMLTRFDAVATVSRPLAEEMMRRLGTARVHLVPNAFEPHRAPVDRRDARARFGVSEHKFLVGSVGRLVEQKGIDLLIEAIALLDEIPLRVVLIGAGAAQDALRALTVERKVAHRIQFMGPWPDANRYFAAFDVFVLSSRTEGTPMVILEAMAAGTPIVTTNVGGVPDVLSPAEAILVAPGDARALAAALRSVYEDAADAALRAQAARRRLTQQFAIEPWLAHYDAIYRSLRRTPARS